MASAPVVLLLAFIGLPGGDDPDECVPLPIAMTDDQDSELKTDAQENEPVFCFRVIGVKVNFGVLVEESSLSFLEGDSMLSLIGAVLGLVPNEPQFSHTYIVRMTFSLCQPHWEVRHQDPAHREDAGDNGMISPFFRGTW